MPSVKENQPTPDDEDVQELPENADTVVWAQEKDGFRCNNVGDYEQYLSDDLLETDPDKEGYKTVVFSPGDEMPLPMAEDIFGAMEHFMAVFDDEGNNLHRGEQVDAHAIERWKLSR